MSTHIVKNTHEDGVELSRPEFWCGRFLEYGWHFMDAQHAAMSAGGNFRPCRNCIKAIIKELSKELEAE